MDYNFTYENLLFSYLFHGGVQAGPPGLLEARPTLQSS